MNGRVNSRGELVAKPPNSLRGRKQHVVDHYGGKGNIRAVLWRSPVNEYTFGDRKSHPQISTPPLDDAEKVLKSADIRTNRVRADRYGEVINIGNRQTLGDSGVEAGYIKHSCLCTLNKCIRFKKEKRKKTCEYSHPSSPLHLWRLKSQHHQKSSSPPSTPLC